MKRLVVGGFERVYEINRNFRNEGVSTQHNPEFTMLELYQAYADYEDFMVLIEDMMSEISVGIHKSESIIYQEKEINFKGPFHRMTMEEAIIKYNPDLNKENIRQGLPRKLRKSPYIKMIKHMNAEKFREIFEKTCEENLVEPILYLKLSNRSLSLLSRRNYWCDPFITDRFEFFYLDVS